MRRASSSRAGAATTTRSDLTPRCADSRPRSSFAPCPRARPRTRTRAATIGSSNFPSTMRTLNLLDGPNAWHQLGYRLTSTIARTLKEHGIKPAPDRPSSWRTFLKAHWGEVAATDFFTTEVSPIAGLKTYYVLFFLELKSLRVHIAGITMNPTDLFMGRAAEGAAGFL